MIPKLICSIFGNGYYFTADRVLRCNSNPLWELLIALFFLFVIGEFIHAVFLGSEEGNMAGVYDDPTAAIQGAEVIEVGGHAVQINTREGLSFLVQKDRNGTAQMWHMENGKTVGNPVAGAPNAWQFGQTQNQSLYEYMKRLVNQKGGR